MVPRNPSCYAAGTLGGDNGAHSGKFLRFEVLGNQNGYQAFLSALKKCLVYMSDQVDGPHGFYTACFRWSSRAFAGIIRLFVTLGGHDQRYQRR